MSLPPGPSAGERQEVPRYESWLRAPEVAGQSGLCPFSSLSVHLGIPQIRLALTHAFPLFSSKDHRADGRIFVLLSTLKLCQLC